MDRLLRESVCRSPGGGTPLYGLYRYVLRDRVWFLEVLDPTYTTTISILLFLKGKKIKERNKERSITTSGNK